ncbi:elongation of very long chain fatty acids protein-like protein [Dinothrombium tinctorium]|uniref:Elongation of very long chain fatty acids protein n=1 Tax=Dinothrombium tinctorium TaxID=1965070 RepID=A0A443RBW9_9ACAR|nr:elongation of very long chain fatty acids protein-like protein [Dinothrombium tinctorium]
MESTKALLVNAFDLYQQFLDSGDPRTNHWMFVASPMPTLLMTAAYLYFVKILGPKLMQNRPAFDLRKLMIVYNLTMIITSLLMFIEMGNLIGWGKYTFHCQKVDYSDAEIPLRMCNIGWYFLLTKYIEFTDTIFFVLRKKQNQISNLHVIHHSLVPITVWVGMKYAPGGNNALFPVLNSFVHSIMYLYYGLSAFGPRIHKYLWWKRYLTTIQLIQFVLILTHGIINFIRDCNFPRVFLVLHKPQSSTSKGGLRISTITLPDGASTSARFGDLTITASVHYARSDDGCHQMIKRKARPPE